MRGRESCLEAFNAALEVCVRTNLSPRWGLSVSHTFPTACAVGCILTPLRGCRLTILFHRVGGDGPILHLRNSSSYAHTEGLLQPKSVQGRVFPQRLKARLILQRIRHR